MSGSGDVIDCKNAKAASIDAAPALFLQVSRDYNGLAFSAVWADYSGLSLDRLMGKGWLELVAPDDRPHLTRLLNGESTEASVDIRIRDRSGKYRWHLVHSTQRSGSASCEAAISLIAIPIDARKAVELAREAERSMLATVMEHAPTMVWTTTADGALDYANTRYLDHWQQTLEQIVDSGWSRSVHPDDMEGITRYWLGHISSKKDGIYEFRAGSPETGYRRYVSVATPQLNAKGDVVKWFGATFDIEEQRQAEEQLRLNEAILRQGQRISKTGSISLNLMSGEHYWSEGTYRILELDTSTAPDSAAYLDRVHRDDRLMVRRKLERIARGEADVKFEHRIALCDGRIKYVRYLTSPAPLDQDEAISLGVVMDITAAKLAEEEEMSRAQTELARVSRIATMAELTASLTHEINQPLSGILTNAEACLRWINRTEPNIAEARDAIDRTVEGARRVSEVVRQLRAVFTRKEPTLAPVDLHRLVEETLPLLRTQITQYRGSVRIAADAGLPRVRADVIQIQQVFMNLVANGLQAPRADSVLERLLVVELVHDEKEVTLSVIDDGTGIDKQQIEQIFEPFYTTKPDGMGMGLSISRSIIESHHGRVFARNANRGAVVGFSLPIAAR